MWSEGKEATKQTLSSDHPVLGDVGAGGGPMIQTTITPEMVDFWADRCDRTQIPIPNPKFQILMPNPYTYDVIFAQPLTLRFRIK